MSFQRFYLVHILKQILKFFVSKLSFDNDSYISQNVGKIIHVEIEKAKWKLVRYIREKENC